MTDTLAFAGNAIPDLAASPGAELGDAGDLLRAGMIDVDLSLFVMLGLFFLFWFLLSRIITRPIMDAQGSLRSTIEGAQRAASQAELEAAKARNTYEQKVSAARTAGVATRERLKAEGTATANEIVAAAKAEADAESAARLGELQAQGARARAEIDSHATTLGDDLAKRLLSSGGGVTAPTGGKA